MAKKYQKLDFEHPRFKKHRRVTQEWLKTHYNKPTTEEEYVEFRRLTKPRKPKNIDSRTWHRKHTPSKWRADYSYLKNTFGLFGENDED